MKPATNVVLAKFGDEAVDRGMFKARGAVAFFCFKHLVWFIDRLRIEHSNVLAAPFEQDFVTFFQPRNIFQVKGYRQTKKLLLWQAHTRHDRSISVLGHEPCKRAE